jgi:hypothetical protein
MKRFAVGLFIVIALVVAVALASDLASLAQNQRTAKQKNDEAARQFVAELRQKDPCYYPSKSGLNTLQSRMVFSILERIRKEIEQDRPKEFQQEDWSSDFYWQAPDLFFVSKESWMQQFHNEFQIAIIRTFQTAPLWILDLAPFPFENYTLEYIHRPSDSCPHLIKATPRDSNKRNYVTELYYDRNYILQKKTIVAYIQKIQLFDFHYQASPAGLLKADFSRRIKEQHVFQYTITHNRTGRFWIPVKVSIDTDALIDTEVRNLLPCIMELKDIRINQPIDPAIQSQLLRYTKE